MDQAGRYISVLMRQLNLFFSHELSEVEITASELMYLSQLYRADGLTQEEMSMEISVDKAATTRTIQGMEKKGLIRREAHEEDRRSKRVYLTDKSKKLEPHIRELQQRWVSRVRGGGFRRTIKTDGKQSQRNQCIGGIVMDMKQAMKERHMVRKYTDQPIPEDIVEKLNARVRENNERYGLSIRLMTNDGSAVPGVIKLILAKGVNNYFIMAGPDSADELCGYCGADLMLYAQMLGLNTWWVGGTYNRKGAQEKSEGAKPVGIIAVGYGQTQGVPHKTKTAEQVSSYAGEAPQWFKDGIEAALLAPTALAKQAFTIRGTENRVSISCDNGIFTGVDTGLVKYHFELGAGKDCFEWV